MPPVIRSAPGRGRRNEGREPETVGTQIPPATHARHQVGTYQVGGARRRGERYTGEIGDRGDPVRGGTSPLLFAEDPEGE